MLLSILWHNWPLFLASSIYLRSSMELLSIAGRHYIIFTRQQHIFRQQQGAAFYWQVPSFYIYKPAAHILQHQVAPFPLEGKKNSTSLCIYL
jgi:hypothetical protein